jgi:hypothetical protein
MSLPRMTKDESQKVSHWRETNVFGPMGWGPKQKKAPPDEAAGPSTQVMGISGEISQEIAVLPVSDVAEGEQILPRDNAAIDAVKASISIGGQAAPITVRKLPGGRYQLLDGSAVIGALRELGQQDVSAIVVSGLSDWEASFRRIASYVRRTLTALDKALIYDRLRELMQEKTVSRDATPAGGHQPNEMHLRKLASHFGFSKDQVWRSAKIARISREAVEKIRELGLEDNQAALLKISGAGATADLQIAKAEELHSRPKRGRSAAPKALPASLTDSGRAEASGTENASDEGGSELPGIPHYLRRDRPEVSRGQLKENWLRVYELYLAADLAAREWFVVQYLVPLVSPAVTREPRE